MSDPKADTAVHFDPIPPTPDSPAGPLRHTTEGPVRGLAQGATDAWYGIPFAAPPVGELRFRRPVPPAMRTTVFTADSWGPAPVQTPRPEAFGGVGENPEMDEDCLTLTIVTPHTESHGPLPVLVWIYGGAFAIGVNRNYDARVLAERTGCVVVSPNYRVGPFGFIDFSALSGPEHVFESNVGLYDQIRALDWVRENIAAFGGDPAAVTVFGESAGAMSVLALMAMPDAHGLFHRAIAQSPAPASMLSVEQAGRWAEVLLDDLATDQTSSAERAQRLARASAAELLQAFEALNEQAPELAPGLMICGPVVDGESLPSAPLAALADGSAAAVPLLIGTNDNEGTLFAIGAQAGGGETIPVLPETLERVFAAAPGWPEVLAAYPDYPRDAPRLGGDAVFWYPTVCAAELHARHNPVWLYRFDYVSEDPRFGAFGATHGAEIPHVFGRSRATVMAEGDSAGDSRDARFSARMMDLWGSFARTGQPGGDWPGFDERERRTLILDAQPRVESDPRSARRAALAAYVQGATGD
ncbi:carboxylesterase/lipase family protein [Brevibacterium moorei]|uniref:carboxylesterase/lipase family protein n=1 Tax=Brevibacterium moorei TaxID=2968457 RepID=UPI00211CE6BA|nr:carboxylesterase/lipase family protein [Brevibacterium sp. 68QC2CO]MCQ9384200.1 carboxylesterase/lipase family protein [Brevibacterium sp. 68QC2CO]